MGAFKWTPEICVFFFSLLSSTVWAKSRVYDITALLADPAASLPIMGNKSVTFKKGFGAGSKILFEDKFPGANWAHPAVYRVIGTDGTVLEEIPSQFPPRNLEAAAPLTDDRLSLVSEPGPAKFQLSDFKGERKVKEPSKFFSLLINGQADQRHWNDSSFLYRVLTTIYGYPKENILVADSLSKEKAPDLDDDGKNDILYESTAAGIQKAIDRLSQVMGKSDHLVVVVNDHGTTEGGESSILLADKEMKAKAFTALFKGLKEAKLFFIYGQCFSGGFVRPSIGQNAIALSASTNAEFSWGTEDMVFDEFMYHLISAFAGQTHDGKPLKTDLNRDGRVSAKEAFAFALARDKTEESPLLEAGPNSNLAQKIGFGF